jgi:hypothetical protein
MLDSISLLYGAAALRLHVDAHRVGILNYMVILWNTQRRLLLGMPSAAVAEAVQKPMAHSCLV